MTSVQHLTRRVLTFLPLLLPVLFYLGTVLLWQSKGLYTITGDEPHYLLIADSLYRDRDLRVENNYLMETPVHKACRANLSDPVDIERHVRNGYSMHYVGLPLMLMLPYGVAGVAGAKIFMTLVAGLWPLLLYRALFQITESRRWSMLIALTVALGLPYLPVSNQLYVDLPGGMIILYVAERVTGILRGRYKPISSLAQNIWLGLLLALLPWLHIRLSAPAMLLLMGYVYARSRARRIRGAEGARPDRSFLIPVALLACSGLSLAAYNQMAFGNAVFGPYYGYLSFDIRKIALTFTGLHWDMAHGIFMQQPLLMLGLFGVVPLIRDNRQSGILLALLSLSVLLPNSMLSLWYGGASFYGRYNWAVASLWIFPLAHAVRVLFRYRKTLVLPLCAVSLLLQSWMASRWLLDDGLLINTGWPAWAARNFYSYQPWLILRMPFFKNVSDYENLSYCLRQPSNYICLLLSFMLVLSGWLWLRSLTRALARLWSLFLIASALIIALVPPATPFWSITPDLLPSQVGRIDDRRRVASEGEAGFLIYGPYVSLIEGEYVLTLEYESSAALESSGAPRFDISYDLGRSVVAEMRLPPSDTNDGKFRHRFAVDKGMSMKERFECRVWYTGSGALILKRLKIAYLHP